MSHDQDRSGETTPLQPAHAVAFLESLANPAVGTRIAREIASYARPGGVDPLGVARDDPPSSKVKGAATLAGSGPPNVRPCRARSHERPVRNLFADRPGVNPDVSGYAHSEVNSAGVAG